MLPGQQRNDLLGPLRRPAIVRAAYALGPLARWWLKPRALAAIGQTPASIDDLPAESGGCWLLLANEDVDTHGRSNEADEGLLRTECLLPCRWTAGPHAENLPAPLARLADTVVDDLADLPAVRAGRFGLRLADDPDACLLHPETLALGEIGSGWAALAAGLWSLVTHAGSNPRIWATGGWRGRQNEFEPGIEPVAARTLAPKIRLARDWGAECLFLPESQVLDARQRLTELAAVAKPEFFGKLLVDAPAPLAALKVYLAALKAPPQPDAPWEEQRAHYLELVRLVGGQGASKFRRNTLEPLIARRIAADFALRLAALPAPPPRQLVTIVSESPELVALTLRALQPQACLLLHTADQQANRDTALRRVQQLKQTPGVRLDCAMRSGVFRNDRHMDRDLRDAVAAFRKTPGMEGGLVFDLSFSAVGEAWSCRFEQLCIRWFQQPVFFGRG